MSALILFANRSAFHQMKRFGRLEADLGVRIGWHRILDPWVLMIYRGSDYQNDGGRGGRHTPAIVSPFDPFTFANGRFSASVNILQAGPLSLEKAKIN